MTYPGGDTVLVIANPTPAGKDSMNEDIPSLPTNRVVAATVYGCVFETEHISEQQHETITSGERAWAFMPYTADTAAITNANWLRPQRPTGESSARDYKVHGLPIVQYDIDGQPDHVWVICENQAG